VGRDGNRCKAEREYACTATDGRSCKWVHCPLSLSCDFHQAEKPKKVGICACGGSRCRCKLLVHYFA